MKPDEMQSADINPLKNPRNGLVKEWSFVGNDGRTEETMREFGAKVGWSWTCLVFRCAVRTGYTSYLGESDTAQRWIRGGERILCLGNHEMMFIVASVYLFMTDHTEKPGQKEQLELQYIRTVGESIAVRQAPLRFFNPSSLGNQRMKSPVGRPSV